MLFAFSNIPIIFNADITVNGTITIRISNLTAFVFVDGKNLFSFYPKGLTYNELKELLKENFFEDEIIINDLELESICKQILSSL